MIGKVIVESSSEIGTFSLPKVVCDFDLPFSSELPSGVIPQINGGIRVSE